MSEQQVSDYLESELKGDMDPDSEIEKSEALKPKSEKDQNENPQKENDCPPKKMDGQVEIKSGDNTVLVTYVEGKKNGEAITYGPNKELICKMHYKDDVLDGEFSSYQTTKFNNKKQSEEVIDSTMVYKNGKLDGPMIKLHPWGAINIKANYTNGLLNGPFEVYDQDGNLSLNENYINGVKDGPSVVYFPITSNKSKVKDNYVTKDLKVCQKSTYKDGLLDGPSQIFYENGKIMQEKIYERGKLKDQKNNLKM